MDTYALKLFQRKSIKSKREILDALDLYSSNLIHDDSNSPDQIFYKPALIELLDRFRRRIQEIDLIYLEKPFAAYEIVITNVDISLYSIEYKQIDFDDHKNIKSAESSEYPPIVCIDARFIDIEEFAQRFSIDIETAVTLINSRKIKCAKKESSGWQVIETQIIPTEYPENGSYVFIGEDGDLSSIAPLSRGTQSFTVFCLDEQDGLFDAISLDSNGWLIEHEQMACEKLHHIEDILISSKNVLFIESFAEIIDEKVIPPFDNNPFLVISEEKILSHIEQLDLPTETKRTLKTIAQDYCGENLFITTLEHLSEKDDFLAYMENKKTEV